MTDDLHDPTGYHARKRERTRRHQALHGVKEEPCVACNGSGHYDDTGSPPCSSCGGTGKVRRPRPAA